MNIKNSVKKAKEYPNRLFIFRLIIFCSITAVVIFILTIIRNNNPYSSYIYPPCFFTELTGIKCLGCGSARAIYNLLNGKVLQALRHNFITVIFFLFLAYTFFNNALSFLFMKDCKKIQLHHRYLWLVVFVIIFFFIARNIPYRVLFF